MRGVAAITVMVYHYFKYFGTKIGISPVLGNAPAAVDLFFVLSGFVIMHSYASKLSEGMTATSYIYRRVVRLYPMFILSLTFGFLVLVFFPSIEGNDLSASRVLHSFLLNSVFLPYVPSTATADHISVFPSNNPLWSLCFEMVASIAFLTLYNWSTKSLAILSTICLLAVIGIGFLPGHTEFLSGALANNFLGGFPRVLYGFALGIVIYRLTVPAKGKYMAALGGFINRYQFLIYGLMFACFAFPMHIKGCYYLLQLIVTIPILVVLGSIVSPKGKFSKRLTAFLGWLSYPLYCLHMPIFWTILLLNQHEHIGGNRFVFLFASFVSVLASTAVTLVYDQPIRKYLRDRLKMVVPVR